MSAATSPVGWKVGPEPDRAGGPVDERERDRQPGLLGEAVEAGLPVVGPAARALGRDGEQEVVRRVDAGHQGLDVGGRVRPVDRHRARGAHDGRERAAEELLLDHDPRLAALAPGEQQREDPVPVGRVRGADDDAVRRQGALGAPAGEAQDCAGETGTDDHAGHGVQATDVRPAARPTPVRAETGVRPPPARPIASTRPLCRRRGPPNARSPPCPRSRSSAPTPASVRSRP